MGFLNGLLFPLFDFVAKNRWAQIVLGLGIFWVIFMIYLSMRDSGVRRVERERQKVESLKEQARVAETRHQIEETRTHDIEQARDAARALPRYGSLERLRNENPRLYAELFGDRAD
ncbi:MAG: hypothetical protein KBF30_07875 [Hyphomonadaceae bacterium]|nr:hypothetical protein [Hyphomonadaceae bacterium]